jgi:enamine deaminase RidA (YjgF/YER057c/UK114 family)
MTITRLRPDRMHETPGYAHVTVVEAGQCPLDVNGDPAGPDLAAQTDQVVANAPAALPAVGAGPGQVVRTVIYVVSDDVSDDDTVLGDVWRRLWVSRWSRRSPRRARCWEWRSSASRASLSSWT